MTTSSATKGLITLSLLFLTMGCSSETKTEKTTETRTKEEATTSKETDEPTTPEEEIVTPKSVKLSGKFLSEDEYGGSHYQVILTIDGKKEILDTVMACEPISVKSRADYDIPADALASCGGWWAGGGDYFYAIWENNNVVVYQGWQDEGQKDNGFHWKAVKR
ncbi:MAG: hypothetical protein A3D31_03740 [Candidatus Fluviicola riflensis]|nr:MAG: hypothetical protein CHH17_11290 [Candidatus Fluviicola riflensis]OGS79090.1 MAG: hypothetical protein A3D31_03740 [Candidatus Fluviicola riflensis]OGS86113.1 MAG: hypothetical protein A3E30_11230 [Fluviicola sp. RIFCSPHIGHO2_12_FULL_43_24]OGS86522.1 MAG: hypothetical protein A2724_03200 [Fluviicola sp. RIFCSPHIGHO2_01_FULL_43_53]